MNSGSAHNVFLTPVLRAAREACQRNVNFRERVCVTGFLCLDVDGERQSHFVINEVIRRTSDEESQSFCLKDSDMKSSTNHVQKRQVGREFTRTFTRQKAFVSSRPETSDRSSPRPGPLHEADKVAGHDTDPQKSRSYVLKAAPDDAQPHWLSHNRHQKAYRTFTIESDIDKSDNENDSKSTRKEKSHHDTRSYHSFVAGPKKMMRSQNRYGNVSPNNKSTTSISTLKRNVYISKCQNDPIKVFGDKRTERLIDHRVKRSRTSPQFRSIAANDVRHIQSNIRCQGANDKDSRVKSIPMDDPFELLDSHGQLFDAEINIASTKPPENFIPSDNEQGSPPDLPNKSYDSQTTPEVTVISDKGNRGKGQSTHSRELSVLLNSVLDAIHKRIDPEHEDNQTQLELPVSPDLSLMDDYARSSSSTTASSHRGASPDCKEDDDSTRLESPSGIKKKAKRFKWMSIFKKDSSPYRHQGPSTSSPTHLQDTESRTSVASSWSSKRFSSPAFKKRRVGHEQ